MGGHTQLPCKGHENRLNIFHDHTIFNETSEVWILPDEGDSWTQLKENCPWPKRHAHAVGVAPAAGVITNAEQRSKVKGPVLLLTGGTGGGAPRAVGSRGVGDEVGERGGEHYDDMWISVDGGSAWTLSQGANFPSRSAHLMLVTGAGDLMIFGGVAAAGGAAGAGSDVPFGLSRAFY